MLGLVLAVLVTGADAGVVKSPVVRQEARVGKSVTVVGTAEDAKGYAVVVVDGSPLYLRDLASWPKEMRGKRVEVTGTLRDEKLIPSPKVDAKGAVSQGADGTQQVLDGATWRAL